ncbi:MAG: sulfatase-like hydrolase/transferase, partial [Cyclobacteriaceae bacterium]|nr:sulfatase-like hydrolase/transferase [Cyclobacteriaceae bacterium]
MKKSTLFAHILLSFFIISGCNKKPAPPNVVLMLADDLGYNDLTCYRNSNHGQSLEFPPTSQTPHIDKLAEEGIRFTDFYCGAAVCSPSRSALITGRNATRVGIYNWIPEESPMHMRASEITIAELLKKKSYNTGHFGKWHLTSKGTDQPLPNDQGFDYSFYAYNNANPSHHNPENYYRNGEPVGKLEGYACQLVVDEALQWLDENNDHQTPFYINVWFNEPHLKVAAPEELTKRHRYNQEYYGAIENMDIAV